MDVRCVSPHDTEFLRQPQRPSSGLASSDLILYNAAVFPALKFVTGGSMIVCQWHLDLVYGKQAKALEIMKRWAKDKFVHSEFKKASGARLLVGVVGKSASHVCDEYYFNSLADFESALKGMSEERFRKHSNALAPYIVSGSQHWEIYRVVE
jgi:hypothetical protein